MWLVLKKSKKKLLKYIKVNQIKKENNTQYGFFKIKGAFKLILSELMKLVQPVYRLELGRVSGLGENLNTSRIIEAPHPIVSCTSLYVFPLEIKFFIKTRRSGVQGPDFLKF